jgi:hypothetical protein
LCSVERTHDLVALHALRLSNTGSDSLHTVVEPGTGIRLSIEFRQNLSRIEVQAVLLHGDFDFLNRHWTEIQKRLESRGVHLAPLRSSVQAGAGVPSQEPGRPQKQSESSKSAFAEFAFGGSMTEAPANRRARTKARRDWESWT